MSYILRVVGTADYAIVAIADAEVTIASLNASGIATPAAAALLGQAEAAFDLGNYASAEELAEQAKSSAVEGDIPFAGYSIILLKLAEAIMNITTSKMAMAARSSGSCARLPVISRLLTASTM